MRAEAVLDMMRYAGLHGGTAADITRTSRTWNPATGCTKKSRGCKNCFALGISLNLASKGVGRYSNGFRYTEHWESVDDVLKWRRPQMVIVDSMSDFFHEEATGKFGHACLDSMMRASQHVYQILTKRPERMLLEVETYCRKVGIGTLPRHIWLGVSVEDEDSAGRMGVLRRVACTTRFVAFEPLVGMIRDANLDGMDWALIGGESGDPRFTAPLKPRWVASLITQCRQQGVPVSFRQWGGRRHDSQGREFNGDVYDELPAYLSGQTRLDQN